MNIKARYLSRFWLVVLPSIVIILGFFFVPYTLYTQDHFGAKSDLLKLIINIGGFVALIAIVLAGWPLYKWIARKQKGKLLLNGSTLTWKALLRTKSIDLSRKFYALVDAGPGIQIGPNLLISVENDDHSVNIGLAKVDRQTVLDIMDDDDFVGKQSIPPEEGSGGFELKPAMGQHAEFSKSLLKLIWDNRNKNESYLVFQRFPWNTPPQPTVAHAKVLADETEANNFIANAAVKVNDSIHLTAHNVLLYAKDKKYHLLPIGHTGVGIDYRPVSIGSTQGGLKFQDFWVFTSISESRSPTIVELVKEESDKEAFLLNHFMMRFINSRYKNI